jgi:TRAP-type C4-dicarboxylate transport system permease small subunit
MQRSEDVSSASAEPAGTTAEARAAHPVLRRLAAADRRLAAVERVLLGLGVLLMALNTIANALARVLFNSSFFFSEELNQFLIVLVTFIGVSTAARMGRHIRMSAFFDMLPENGRRMMMAVIALGTAVVLLLLAWFAVEYVYSLYVSGRMTPSLRWPVWLTLLWIPLGLVLAGVQFAFAAVANLTLPGVHLSFTVEAKDDDAAPDDANRAL